MNSEEVTEQYIARLKSSLPNFGATKNLVEEALRDDRADLRQIFSAIGYFLQYSSSSRCDEITHYVYERIYSAEDKAMTEVRHVSELWSEFSKARYTWCYRYFKWCLSIHLVTFYATLTLLAHNKNKKFEDSFGQSLSLNAYSKASKYLVAFWGIIWLIRIVYRNVIMCFLSPRWVKFVNILARGVNLISLPIISVLCNFDGFDNLVAFAMLVIGTCCVSSGLGLFFITDDFGISSVLLTTALSVLTKVSENQMARAITSVFIVLCSNHIQPCVKRIVKSWCLGSHRPCLGLPVLRREMEEPPEILNREKVEFDRKVAERDGRWIQRLSIVRLARGIWRRGPI